MGLWLMFWLWLPGIASSQAVNPENHSVQLALTTEPPDLNSLTSTDSVSFFILLHTQEGLLSYGEDDQLTGGVAEQWEMDGTRVRFTLRENARWCDGKPVTAQDFVFAWRTALDPSTASRYGFILYPLKNAEKIHNGALPTETLGVTAIDDRHLEIMLEKPTAYFLSLTSFPTYFPLREDFYRAHKARYGAEAETLLCNGPFQLTKWTHGANLTLRKNAHYWQANRVALEQIHIPHISNDPNTLFNLFQANEIALTELGNDTVRQALQQRLHIESFGNGMLTYLEFNMRAGRATNQLALRRAITEQISRQTLVNKVIAAPGTQAATRFIPQWFYHVEDTTPETGPDATIPTLEKIPPLTLLVYDSPAVVRQAEYLQKVLKDALDLDIVIDRQIFKQKLAKLATGDFDLSISAWGPDYNDPMTFGDLLHSRNENNHGAYQSAQYDALVEQAGNLPDGAERNALFTQINMQVERDQPVFPLTEPGILFVQHRQLEGVVRRRFGGDPDLRFARLVEGTR